jgi:hypothetical protein
MSVRNREEVVVARLHDLAPHLDGEPDPAFRAATRARLVAMAAVRTPAPAPASGLKRFLARAEDRAPSAWRSRLTAGLAGAAVAVTALAGLVAVSTDAQPGDPLYGLKRGTEQTQLALASDASRGQTLLGFASTRLDELESLVAEGATALPAAAGAPGSTTVLAAGADTGLILETIETMDAQTVEGAAWLTDRAVTSGDQEPLEDLEVWADGQTAGLEALSGQVPAEARDAVANSLALLSDVAVRTTGLQEAVDCASGPAVTGTDDLGPVPGLCLPDAPATGGGTSTSGTPGVPGTDPAPQATTPTLPTVPGTGGTGGLPTGPGGVPGVPTLPSTSSDGGGGGIVPPLPTPSLPLPSVSLPGSNTTASSPATTTPSLPTLKVCLPPVTINC